MTSSLSALASRRNFLRMASASPLLLSACGQGEIYTGPSIVTKWNAVALDAVRAGTLPPPMVARALAILYTSMYDAWAPYDLKAVATRPGGPERLSRPADQANLLAVREKAMSYAAHAALKDLYPDQAARFDAMMASLGLDPSAGLSGTDPGQIGRDAAARVLAYRHADGSNQLGDLAPGAYTDYTGYVPVNTPDVINDPNQWQPLRFSNGKAPAYIGPHWGLVKPFSLTAGAQLRMTTALPRFGSQAYKDQADEVLAYTANLTDEQKVIAEYWANGPKSETPPGQWHKIAGWVSERDQFSLDNDIKLFFLLGNAVMDAAICCWECKRYYNSVRPITAIRSLYAGQQVKGLISAQKGIGLMPGEQWLPYQLSTFITPPFPEFVSGHSTFSAASAEILKRFTGSDAYGGSESFAAGTMTHQAATPQQAVTLSWSTFSDAAQEAGISRLYGGIHFAAGNLNGQTMGAKVAASVWEKGWNLFSGIRS